jgi:hypothetical protein
MICKTTMRIRKPSPKWSWTVDVFHGYAVKNDYKNNRFYPEIMTQFGQYRGGQSLQRLWRGSSWQASSRARRLWPIKQWIAKKKLKRAKP